jgi:uncharacterized membrane-anchored protein
VIWILVKIAILATAIVGGAASVYMLSEYVTDRLALGDRNGDGRITAAIGIRTAAMVCLVLLLFMVFAIIGLLSPPPQPDRVTTAIVNFSIFEAITLTLTVLTVLNLRDRIRQRIRWSREKDDPAS